MDRGAWQTMVHGVEKSWTRLSDFTSLHSLPRASVLFILILTAELILFTCCAVLSRFSRVWLFETLQTVALQSPLSMRFSRHEYWSGLPCPPPGHLPDPGIEPMSLTSPALAGGFFTTSTTWEAPFTCFYYFMCKSICMYMYKVIKARWCFYCWMVSPTRWTGVWASSWSWWWTGRPGMLESMGLQRVGHNWAIELNRCIGNVLIKFYPKE